MNKLVALFLLICSTSFAQNEFDKYGPMGCQVYEDLEEALKAKGRVYKLDLNLKPINKKQYPKLSELKDLLALRMRGNGVTTYPEGFNKLVYLSYFASYANALTAFPTDLRTFFNLEYLELQNTKIDSIPAEIVYLQKLHSFKFGNTDDTLKLPTTLKYIKNMKDISLENVIMDSLPKEVLKVQSLIFLYLSNTNTHYLSKHFDRLKNLEVLILENNPITSIPSQIYMAKKLRMISFRNNKLTNIPETITELKELALLDLRGNPIQQEEIDKLKALLPDCQIKF
jgi:Leucine-rich repeat (LRR) protein